jgi:Family of unknown function (DUF6518)
MASDKLLGIRESSALTHSQKETSAPTALSRTRDVARVLLAAAVIGIAIGAATAILETHLTQPWNALANAASPWLLGGFVAGAVARRSRLAVLGGLSACAIMVAAYYGTAALTDHPVARYLGAFWLGCAVVGGPVSGLAGWAWRRGSGRVRAYGAAFPSGTFIAEAVGAYGFRLHYHPAAALFLLIGVALLCLLIRRVPLPGFLAWTVIFVVAGAIVYGPLLDAVVGTYSGGINYGPLHSGAFGPALKAPRLRPRA